MSEKIPTPEKNQKGFEVFLPEEPMTTKEILEELDRKGLRPVTLKELKKFGLKPNKKSKKGSKK